jgi:microcystin-dependent protein
MPSSNGVYSLPAGYLAVTGATIQASQHNPPLEDIAAALTGRLSRDGTAAMVGPLQAALGTVGAPGIVFSTDPTTGLYKTTAGIGVSVGGTKVAEFTAAGLASGVWFPGMILPFTGTAAPSLPWVLPFGQTLSRTTYGGLWAFAQIEIAAGNTSYNNGDGSTTFGIPDMRGRMPVGWDKMGGSAAGRLTTAGSGIDGTTLGTAGGAQSVAMALANLIQHNHSITDPGHSHGLNFTYGGGGAPGNYNTGGGVQALNNPIAASVNSATTGITINNTGSASPTPIVVMPPVVVTNYLLFTGRTA